MGTKTDSFLFLENSFFLKAKGRPSQNHISLKFYIYIAFFIAFYISLRTAINDDPTMQCHVFPFKSTVLDCECWYFNYYGT